METWVWLLAGMFIIIWAATSIQVAPSDGPIQLGPDPDWDAQWAADASETDGAQTAESPDNAASLRNVSPSAAPVGLPELQPSAVPAAVPTIAPRASHGRRRGGAAGTVRQRAMAGRLSHGAWGRKTWRGDTWSRPVTQIPYGRLGTRQGA